MKTKSTLPPRGSWVLFGSMFALLVGLSVFPDRANAQTPVAGNKAVYNANGVAPSTIWIDASAFWTSGTPDLCVIVHDDILTSSGYPANGAVIDARGLVRPNGGPINCTVDPWHDPPANGWPPSTVLLPASNIQTNATWTLPNNTRISGEGPNTELTASDPNSGTFSGTDIIDIGSSGLCPSQGCSGIAVEHLKLQDNTNNGAGSLNGIVNDYSQNGSYVNDVALYNIGQTGIVIGAPSGQTPGAINSGPYSNISYTAAACNGNACPACVDFEAQTRGLHGITCIGDKSVSNVSSAPGHAGIYVNASNNSIEDVHIEGFWDGIQIGDTTNTVGNVVVSNLNAAYGGGGPVTNAVHICGPNHQESLGACTNNGPVSDVTILQASDVSGGKCTTTILDDLTGTAIGPTTGGNTPSTAVPQFVGLYGLGEVTVPSSSTAQHSRFATTPSSAYGPQNCEIAQTNTYYNLSITVVPTWGVGTTPAAGNSCVTPGGLYSNTTGSSGSAVLVCTGTSPNFTWQSIP